ncbi:Putative sugar phosphate/phosphate translocator [Glycine soja]|uniref:Putative sugar phosphate/phosphate translocator n=1 Tax=Glycine soja TaxID=3848 RepID=A0A0B2QJ81_GLYSO|nr:Putative sugar phosphate/phosphate translocator [Glycine soja]
MKGLNNRFFTVGLWRRGTLPTLACFKYPIFLTMCHMSYVAIAWMKVVPLQTLRSRVQFFKISALSLVFCVSVVFGNISLCYLPMSFNQAIGATMPFFIAVFAYLMTLKREAGLTYLTLVPVVTGVIIASGLTAYHESDAIGPIHIKSLWGKENELTAEIDKLRAEVEKAEKSLDHAIPGVSNPSF